CPVCQVDNREGAVVCQVCAAPLAGAPAEAAQALPAGTQLQGGAFTVGRGRGQGGVGVTLPGAGHRLGGGGGGQEVLPGGAARRGSKLLPGGGMTGEEYAAARARFLEEARLLARFQHAGIVQVYTSFEENDTAYMVMEFLKGRTLAQRVEAEGPLPEPEATATVERVTEALAAVHLAGLLHRDIKPENVIVTESGRVALIDFGTAREFTAGATRRMTTVLTPGFAPLEQYSQQGRFGPYTDLYALGATFYFLLTGQPPVASLDRIQGVALPPPATVNPAISPRAAEAAMWALEMQVAHRPQTAQEFLEALREGHGELAGLRVGGKHERTTSPPHQPAMPVA